MKRQKFWMKPIGDIKKYEATMSARKSVDPTKEKLNLVSSPVVKPK